MYDVINHDILLDKLNSYGILGKTNLQFKSYLMHRAQFVETNQSDHRNAIHKIYFLKQRNKTQSIIRLNCRAPFISTV